MQEEYLKKRTLYLIERGNKTTVSRDGPSVLIERNFSAPVRIPADYIDRVIIYGNVALDAFSLTLFSSKYIPILIIGRHGESSIILPYSDGIDSYSKYQKMMIASKKMTDEFTMYAYKHRVENQKKTLDSLFKDIKVSAEQGENSYQSMINKIKPSEFLWQIVKNIIKNLFLLAILSKVLTVKLDPHIGFINQQSNYGLIFDIYYIFEPIVDFLTFQFFYEDGVNIDFIKNPDMNYERLQMLVEKFESKREDFDAQIRVVITEILSYLRNIKP